MTLPLCNELTLSILHFNLLPSQYLHASWRSQYFPNQLIAILFSTRHIENHLSRYILKKSGLGNAFYFDEHWPYWEIILASEKQLTRCVMAIGYLLLRPLIKRAIDRTQVMYYRKQLGEFYSFVLEKGPLLCPKSLSLTVDPEQIPQKAHELGALVLKHAASLFSNEIQSRFIWKIPYSTLSLNAHDTNLSAQQALKLWIQVNDEVNSRLN